MTESARRRKVVSILLGACLLALFLVLASMNAFKNFLNPATPGQVAVFTGLSAMAFVLFVGVLLLLVRNVLKLYADQSSRLMGKRLRTRMLWGAVLVSLIPIAFMFAFSYLLMNRAVDRWFFAAGDADARRQYAHRPATGAVHGGERAGGGRLNYRRAARTAHQRASGLPGGFGQDAGGAARA